MANRQGGWLMALRREMMAAAPRMERDSVLGPPQAAKAMPDSIPAVDALEEVLSSPLRQSSLGRHDMDPDFEFGLPGSLDDIPVPGAELLDGPLDAFA